MKRTVNPKTAFNNIDNDDNKNDKNDNNDNNENNENNDNNKQLYDLIFQCSAERFLIGVKKTSIGRSDRERGRLTIGNIGELTAIVLYFRLFEIMQVFFYLLDIKRLTMPTMGNEKLGFDSGEGAASSRSTKYPIPRRKERMALH